jgi:hypothetical protein
LLYLHGHHFVSTFFHYHCFIPTAPQFILAILHHYMFPIALLKIIKTVQNKTKRPWCTRGVIYFESFPKRARARKHINTHTHTHTHTHKTFFFVWEPDNFIRNKLRQIYKEGCGALHCSLCLFSQGVRCKGCSQSKYSPSLNCVHTNVWIHITMCYKS